MARRSAHGWPRVGSTTCPQRFVLLGGLVNHGGTARQLVRELGVGKQTESQLVDARSCAVT